MTKDWRDEDEEEDWKPAWDRAHYRPPSRKPTTREKFSVLLPALLAFIGMIAMLVIFIIVAVMRS